MNAAAKPIVMYDLVGQEDRRFSPYCWRARMALAHKGLEVETRATRFTEIADILGGGQRTVPVIADGERVVADSWAIAEYLEAAYPDAPSLFGGESGLSLTRFVRYWFDANYMAEIARMIVHDIYLRAEPVDRDYFRAAREKRFGQTLEELQGDREQRRAAFRAALEPLRLCLKRQPFLGGETPRFADYVVFGSLQWPRVISPFPLLETDDIVQEWFERCLDLHGGLGRSMPAAA